MCNEREEDQDEKEHETEPGEPYSPQYPWLAVVPDDASTSLHRATITLLQTRYVNAADKEIQLP